MDTIHFLPILGSMFVSSCIWCPNPPLMEKNQAKQNLEHMYILLAPPKVAMRSMEFCVKKAEVKKLMAEYSKHPSREIDHLEFMQIS